MILVVERNWSPIRARIGICPRRKRRLSEVLDEVTSDKKQCPYCKHYLTIRVHAIDDGQDLDEMNTRITVEPYAREAKRRETCHLPGQKQVPIAREEKIV